MRTVVKAENLSKKFRIGGVHSNTGTLRDVLGNILRYSVSSEQDQNSKEIWALKDVSFEIKEGETFGIIGGNGAGKSTLLKILSRIIKPTRGYAKLRGRVGSLLEIGTGFHQDLTGRENIFLNGAVLGMRRQEVEKKFDEIIAFADIEEFLDTPVKFYSTGMYARLAFAVAAHLEPEILIVDEVLAVGDAAFQAKCLGKMGNVAESGRTVIFVSHDSASVTRLCKTGLYLQKGAIRKIGNMEEVMAHYKFDYEATISSESGISRKIEDICDGQCRFTQWRILNAKNRSPHEIVTKSEAILEFDFVSRRQKDKMKFILIIKDFFNRIVVASTFVAEIDSGKNRIQWTGILPIRADFYRITVKVESLTEDVVLDAWDCDPMLSVLPAGKILIGEVEGIVNVDCSINVLSEEGLERPVKIHN